MIGELKYCFNIIVLAIYFIISVTYVNAETNINKKKIIHKSSAKKTHTKKISNKNKLSSKKTNSALSYTIKKGDTIRKIAKLKGVSEKEIIAINKNINPKMLKPGQKILIPPSNIAKTNNEIRNYAELSRTSKRYSVAKEEVEKLEKFKNISNSTYTSDEEDFEGDEGVPAENFSDVENKKEDYLYSLRDDDLKKLINSALDYVGATYRYGGDSIASLDCSAFVRRVFREVNINLPRTSREQYTLGTEVSIDELKEGDLLFFAKKNRINHVGIYIGNNMYIHAARKGKGVIVSSLESPYVKKHFVGAKRLFTLQSASNEKLLKEKLIN